MNYSISCMNLKDLPEVMELEMGCFASPWCEQAFRDELAREFSHIFLARDDGGSLIGFICFWVLLGEMHILNLAVRTDARRKGYGRSLVLEALDFAAGMGARSATLEVREKNVAAVRLYERLGFVRAGMRKGYYEFPRDNAVIMWVHNIVEMLEKSLEV